MNDLLRVEISHQLTIDRVSVYCKYDDTISIFLDNHEFKITIEQLIKSLYRDKINHISE